MSSTQTIPWPRFPAPGDDLPLLRAPVLGVSWVLERGGGELGEAIGGETGGGGGGTEGADEAGRGGGGADGAKSFCPRAFRAA